MLHIYDWRHRIIDYCAKLANNWLLLLWQKKMKLKLLLRTNQLFRSHIQVVVNKLIATIVTCCCHSRHHWLWLFFFYYYHADMGAVINAVIIHLCVCHYT
jgi:hypothetical protein